jgi:hypothetical protein
MEQAFRTADFSRRLSRFRAKRTPDRAKKTRQIRGRQIFFGSIRRKPQRALYHENDHGFFCVWAIPPECNAIQAGDRQRTNESLLWIRVIEHYFRRKTGDRFIENPAWTSHLVSRSPRQGLFDHGSRKVRRADCSMSCRLPTARVEMSSSLRLYSSVTSRPSLSERKT